MLTPWQQASRGRITFTDLATKWAPGNGDYGRMMQAIAEKFQNDFCSQPDPRPELVREARAPRWPARTRAARQGADDRLPRRRRSGEELAQARDRDRPRRRAPASAPAWSPARAGGSPRPARLQGSSTPPPAPDTKATGTRHDEGGRPRHQDRGGTDNPGRRRQRPAHGTRRRWHCRRQGQGDAGNGRATGRQPEMPRVDGELRRAEGDHHPLGGRPGGQLHGARRQRGRGDSARPRRSLPPTPRTEGSPANMPTSRRPSTRPSSSARKAEVLRLKRAAGRA